MRRIALSITILIMALSIYAQVPLTFKYQAVARDNTGNVIASQNVSIQISILQGSVGGTSVYIESHNLLTNEFGLVNFEIGNGNVASGVFEEIDWGNDSYFLQIEMDETGGDNYQLMGISQLLSVPYANYSVTTGDTSMWQKDNEGIYYKKGNVGIGAESSSIHSLNVDGGAQLIDGSVFLTEDSTGIYVDGIRSMHFEGFNNTFLGENAGASATSNVNYNVGIGDRALYSMSAAGTNYNVAIGSRALYNHTYGNGNTAIGHQALRNDISGFSNVSIGENTMTSNINGGGNVAVGNESLQGNETGNENVAVGADAYNVNPWGSSNTAIGTKSLRYLKDQFGWTDNNVAVGYKAGSYVANGTTTLLKAGNSVYVGYMTRSGSDQATAILNENVFGYDAIGHGSNTATIGNDAITDVWMNENGAGVIHLGHANLTPKNQPTGVEGTLYTDATSHKLYHHNGTYWEDLSSGSLWAEDTYGIGYSLGNVGILGSADPIHALSVSGGVKTTGSLYFTDDSCGIFMGGEYALRIDAGSVLIGDDIGNEWHHCVAIGQDVFQNSNGNNIGNVGIGYLTMLNFSGSNSTAVGSDAMTDAIDGDRNTAIGAYALHALNDAVANSNNTALGESAGRFLADGVAESTGHDRSVFLGSKSRTGATTNGTFPVNEIVIGYDAVGHDANTATIGNGDITDVWMNQDGTADIHGGTIILSDETEPEPVNNMMYFLNEVNSDPDTIAVYNGTAWKYFISQ